MSTTAVICKSKYGYARQYAKWIAAALDADFFELGKGACPAFSGYRTIIYGAGLYAGAVNGIREFRKIFSECGGASFVLFTVGISSSENPDYLADVTARNLTSEMRARVKVFYLRGGIDYKKLSPAHRAMMWMMSRMLRGKKPDALTEDDKTLLASYGKRISFLDESNVEPILSHVCRSGE